MPLMMRSLAAGSLVLMCSSLYTPSINAQGDVGPFVRALWITHGYGTVESISPENDQKLKSTLAKALGKDGVLTWTGAQAIMDSSTFSKLAGSDNSLDDSEMRKVIQESTPQSRERLLPEIVAHAEKLTTSFDLIDEKHRQAGEKLVNWIIEHYRPGQELHVTVVCTGNSRRSILGATTGNIAAAYYGLSEIRFHSGGTDPTAFNSRTIKTLEGMGVRISNTGQEAPRGEPETPNPICGVQWGIPGQPEMQATEFSKPYFDSSNPQTGFAALLVCAEADAGCPFVKGASIRISMPYMDPKAFDGSIFEEEKYAERRDDIARLMLSVMMQVRNRLGRNSP